MTAALLVAVALAGGAGAVLRYVVDGLIRARARGPFPVGTFVVNVSGSFAIGLVAGLLPTEGALGDLHTVIATGLLGGYTTFSTASFETVRLVQQRRAGAALASSLGMLAATIAAAVLGVAVGSGVPR